MKFIFSSTSNEIKPEYLKYKLSINYDKSKNVLIEPFLFELTVPDNLKSLIKLFIQKNTSSIEYQLL